MTFLLITLLTSTIDHSQFPSSIFKLSPIFAPQKVFARLPLSVAIPSCLPWNT
ncbi:MAG: hypothetical protein J0I41_12605 [Filimonas sp.]|nr:hypothetical protein [Filimonas sp.]